MKYIVVILLLCLSEIGIAQQVHGKWIGKVTQGPGGYAELYDLTLELTQKSNIWGESVSTEGDSIRVVIGLSGFIDRDSVRLSESLSWIRQDRVPWLYVACIKSFALAYRKEGDFEYLEGTWNGFDKTDPGKLCIPGKVILSRTVEGLQSFLNARKDSVYQVKTSTTIIPTQKIDFTERFKDTEAKKTTEIEVFQPEIQIQLMDYMKVDNDTISVYLNRKLLAEKIWISKKPALIKFSLDKSVELHELLLYAENLGYIPPNTSELIVIDGEFRHRVMISSDLQKTAAVYLRYKPQKTRK